MFVKLRFLILWCRLIFRTFGLTFVDQPLFVLQVGTRASSVHEFFKSCPK